MFYSVPTFGRGLLQPGGDHGANVLEQARREPMGPMDTFKPGNALTYIRSAFCRRIGVHFSLIAHPGDLLGQVPLRRDMPSCTSAWRDSAGSYMVDWAGPETGPPDCRVSVRPSGTGSAGVRLARVRVASTAESQCGPALTPIAIHDRGPARFSHGPPTLPAGTADNCSAIKRWHHLPRAGCPGDRPSLCRGLKTFPIIAGIADMHIPSPRPHASGKNHH